MVGATQVVSIGSLYPVVSAVIDQKDQTNVLIQYFDKIINMFGLNVSLINYLILFITISVISGVIYVIVEIDQGRFLRKIEYQLRYSFVQTVVMSKWSSLRALNHGGFINAVNREAELYKVLVKYLFLIIGNAIQVLFMTIFIVAFDLSFAVLSTVMLITGFIIFVPVMRIAHKFGNDWTEAFSIQTDTLLNATRAFKNIKTGSLETFLLKHLKPIIYRVSNIYYKQQVLTAFQIKLSEIVGYTILSVLLYIGIDMFKLPAAKLILFIVVLVKVIPQVKAITTYLHQAYAGLPSLSKIREIQKNVETAEPKSKSMGETIQTITFQSVGFKYDNNKLFNSLSAEFQRGEFWAISGPTGSGKTTVLDLISGIIEPSAGDIFYGGVNSREAKRPSLHKRVGYLTQDSFVFAGSILENVIWGQENVDSSKIEQALKAAQLEDMVQEKTLDYQIAESGQNLSGGQQQRIAIARVLLSDYDFILMDEPSSALDAETEKEIISSLIALKGKVGIIMVTHREEYVKYADHQLIFNKHNVIKL